MSDHIGHIDHIVHIALRKANNLGGSESAETSQTALGGRARVRVGAVPVTQNVPRRLVEAVVMLDPARLLMRRRQVVTDGRRRRVTLADAVLVDGVQGTSTTLTPWALVLVDGVQRTSTTLTPWALVFVNGVQRTSSGP